MINDVARFPIMLYRGIGVTPQLGGRWTVDGELTVRNLTRPVPLDGVFIGALVAASDHERLAFQATAAISRKEFGLTTDLDKESGGFLLGRDITIEIDSRGDPR